MSDVVDSKSLHEDSICDDAYVYADKRGEDLVFPLMEVLLILFFVIALSR